MKKLIPILFTSLCLAACSSPEVRDFTVSAITTDKQPVKCFIYTDNQPVLNPASQEILTPATIPIKFEKSKRGSGYDTVTLEVKEVKFGADGKPIPPPEKLDKNQLHADPRQIQVNDAKQQLFILY